MPYASAAIACAPPTRYTSSTPTSAAAASVGRGHAPVGGRAARTARARRRRRPAPGSRSSARSTGRRRARPARSRPARSTGTASSRSCDAVAQRGRSSLAPLRLVVRADLAGGVLERSPEVARDRVEGGGDLRQAGPRGRRRRRPSNRSVSSRSAASPRARTSAMIARTLTSASVSSSSAGPASERGPDRRRRRGGRVGRAWGRRAIVISAPLFTCAIAAELSVRARLAACRRTSPSSRPCARRSRS